MVITSLQIQGNRSSSDVLLYYTTTGWMMWNWMVSALALGTTLVLYDGSPLLPHPVRHFPGNPGITQQTFSEKS